MSSKSAIPHSAKDKYREIVRTLEEYGVASHTLRRNGANHIVLQFEKDGRCGSLTFAGTPGDRRRALQQARGLVRRALRNMGILK